MSFVLKILWREAGWKPVPLTDLLAAASVKKAYRKATLCVHPDKVQQKGATVQQKYIAEKVFDLLKVVKRVLCRSIYMHMEICICLHMHTKYYMGKH